MSRLMNRVPYNPELETARADLFDYASCCESLKRCTLEQLDDLATFIANDWLARRIVGSGTTVVAETQADS